MNKFSIPKSKEEWILWYSKYSIYVILIGVFISVIVLVNVGKYVFSDKTPDVVTQSEQYKSTKAEIDEFFASLEPDTIEGTENRPQITLHLYLKNPYTSESDYSETLTKIKDYYLWKYNSENKKVISLKMFVYDRYNTYKEGILPRDVAEYTIHDISKDKYKDKYKQIEDAGENEQALLKDFASIDTYEVDYDSDFSMTSSYSEILDRDLTLSNEEMNLLIKLTKYAILSDGAFMSSEDLRFLDKYLLWELGYLPEKESVKLNEYQKNLLVKEFSSLISRYLNNFNNSISSLQEVPRERDYNDFKKDLAISNPKFLAYLESANLLKTTKEARKELIAIDNENKKLQDMYIDNYYISYYDIFLDDAKQKLIDENGQEPDESVIKEYMESGESSKNTLIDIDKNSDDSSSSDDSDDNSVKDNSTDSESTKDSSDDSNAFSDENL